MKYPTKLFLLVVSIAAMMFIAACNIGPLAGQISIGTKIACSAAEAGSTRCDSHNISVQQCSLMGESYVWTTSEQCPADENSGRICKVSSPTTAGCVSGGCVYKDTNGEYFGAEQGQSGCDQNLAVKCMNSPAETITDCVLSSVSAGPVCQDGNCVCLTTDDCTASGKGVYCLNSNCISCAPDPANCIYSECSLTGTDPTCSDTTCTRASQEGLACTGGICRSEVCTPKMDNNVLLMHFDEADSIFNDDFSAAALDPAKWAFTGTGTATIQSEKLHIVGGGTGWLNAGVTSKDLMNLIGDFDVQVDFSGLSWTGGTDGGPMLMVQTSDNTKAFYVRRNIAGRYDRDVYITPNYVSYSYVAGSGTSGRFRITRVGSTMYSYYWDSTNLKWAQIGASYSLSNADMHAKLLFNSYNSNPAIVDFDNFLATYSVGTSKADSSGKNNNGANYGKAVSAASKDGFGNALRFDGHNDYAQIPSSSTLDLSGGQFTVEFWTKMDSLLATGRHAVFVSRLGTTVQGWQVIFDASKNIAGMFRSSTGDNLFSVNYPTLAAGNWYHIVYTYQAVGSDATVNLFINGQRIGTKTFVGKTMGTPTGVMYIGTNKDGAPANNFGGREFSGIVDDVAVYSRALSDEEILLHYNLNKPLPNP